MAIAAMVKNRWDTLRQHSMGSAAMDGNPPREYRYPNSSPKRLQSSK